MTAGMQFADSTLQFNFDADFVARDG